MVTSFRGQGFRYAAAIDDGDAVGETQDLVEIIGDEEHRCSPLARLDQMLMHIGHSTDIQAARRLAGENEAGFERERAPQDQLLHVAAGQEPHACLGRRAFHVELQDDVAGEIFRRGPIEEAALAEAFLAIELGDDILGHRHVGDEAFRLPVFRDAGDAVPGHDIGCPARRILAENMERAATRAREAAQQIGERGLAVARDAGEAEDLAAMQREVGAIEPVRR